MSRPRRRHRFILWTAGGLLATITACLLLVMMMANSETASRRLLQQAADSAGIEIGRISGALATGVEVENLRYDRGAVAIRIDEFGFDWQPLALLYGTVGFGSLRLDGVRIEYTPQSPSTAKTAQLPDVSLPLRLSIAEADVNNLRVNYAGREYTVDRISLDAALGSALTLDRLTLEAPQYELSAQGSIDGGFPYESELTLQWQYRLDSGIEFAGTADVAGDIERLEIEHQLTAPVDLATAGSLVTGLGGDAAPRVEMHNRWNGLQLQPPLIPFAGDSDGELDITGWLNDYRLRGQGRVTIESGKLPSFGFTLDAAGDRAGLETAELALATLGGTIAINGAAQWTPGLEWRADVASENIDLSRYHPQLPKQLQLDFHTEGTRADAVWRGRFEDIAGAGQAGVYPLRLRGALAFEGASFSSPSLRLAVGENALTLSGGVNRRLDLQWELHFPRLSALWPGLQGALNGSGRLSGNRNSPHFQAVLTGQDLVYADYRVDRLNARLQTEQPRRHALTLEAEQVTLRGRTLSTLTLNARGDTAGHRIESRIQDDYLTADAVVEGGYRDSNWRGTLRRARWQAGDLPEWALQQPFGITVGSGRVHMEQTCWSAGQARFCAQLAAGGGGDINGTASLDSVPAALLDPWLPPPVKIEGEIAGTLTVSGRNLEDLTGNLELEAPAGRIGVRREGMPTDQYLWENTFLRATLQKGQITATAGLSFPGYGGAESTVTIDLANRSLDGAVTAHFDNLAPLQTAVADLDELEGRLETSLKITGTLDRPRFAGSVLLRNASTRIPRMGIQIRDLQFSARSDNGSDFVFEGRAESGGGSLEITGRLAYGATPLLEASVKGEAFQLLRQPQVQARISPQLDIRAQPGQASIRGTVRIPSARIEILEPPESVVAVSQDVIIMDETFGETPTANGMQLAVRVQLILGEDVQFQGFGFTAGLGGELVLNKTPGRPVATTGELDIRQGQYKAFGQKLEIDRGRLLFQGPYDNPGLDILAVRKTPDVTVSLEIGGTLDSPHSRVFSEPPLPDSEAMAILLTGKPLGSASETDANALVSAVAGLGLRKGQFITDEIARAFSLDEFRIKTESDVTASSLFIGKRISPRLFIRYIVGLFDQTSKIGLSYQLSEHLRLEAESGWSQSMDLIYEIER